LRREISSDRIRKLVKEIIVTGDYIKRLSNRKWRELLGRYIFGPEQTVIKKAARRFAQTLWDARFLSESDS
jgi:hypothetical protein